MQQLTQQGQNIVSDLSKRTGFSINAVHHMLIAVLNGNGSMAQFNHPEFAGSGQWMRGGMLMLSDMFNSSLKGRVAALCSEIAMILANQPGLLQSGSFQSQSQGGSGHQQQASGGGFGESTLFVADPSAKWWPQDLGTPNASGKQNNVKYAYFGNARRLAVETNGQVWVYDTQDHQIGGFSQQQGSGGSILFTSQFGTVNLSTLPVVSIDGQTPVKPQPAPESPAAFVKNTEDACSMAPFAPSTFSLKSEEDIFATIERLNDLFLKGILTADEFGAKKLELLARL